jgi:glucose/arabinose dehydrogenase
MLGGGPTVGLRLVADGLVHPVTLMEAPDGTGRLFIVDQAGTIRVVMPDGSLAPDPFLDVTSRMVTLRAGYDERGLLGLAFHPDFATNGRFFIYYTAPPRLDGYDNTSVVAEYHVTPGDVSAEPTFTRIVIQEDQPQFNHEGGTVAFGPDGYLYISWGDGGGASDIGSATAEEWMAGDHQGHVPDWYEVNAGGNGQDLEANLLGNILRIDVDHGAPYTVPMDNPFVGRPGRDEVYAYGFRNPYRFSFDMGGSHDLLVGDAGQNMWEEVSLVTKGGNYGWNVKEGTHCFDASDVHNVLPSCPDVDAATGIPLTDPVIEVPNYDNPLTEEGWVVVVGGYVYRGSAVPQLYGRYLVGAYSTDDEEPEGAVYMARRRPAGLWSLQELKFADRPGGELGELEIGFGQDLEGEVYVLTALGGPSGTTGKVYRITRPGAAAEVPIDVRPTTISLSRSSTVTVYAYSTGEFDASAIDPASAHLVVDGRGAGAAVAQQGGRWMTIVRDYNGDGRDDRLLVFRVSDLAAAGLSTSSHELALTGQAGGASFRGTDAGPPSFVP